MTSASYEAMYQPTKLTSGAMRPYGFGWQFGKIEDHHSIGHGGGINGFSTMIQRYPDDRLAVIVLSNTASANSGAAANRIAQVMLGVEDKRAEKKPAEEKEIVDETVDETLGEQLSGKYQFMDVELAVSPADGQLFAKLKGRSADRLKYQGERDFIHAGDEELRITFTPKEGQAEAMEIKGKGFRMRASGWSEGGGDCNAPSRGRRQPVLWPDLCG